MRHFLLLLPLLLAAPARACLNDRDSDSLALQAAQFPDTLRVITGRFERQPPLFYQMRIRRSLAELKKSPRDFGKYDDIAVAFDKLHRDDEALAIMAKKRALLPAFDAKNPALKEAWYRYFANTGTFHAHRFMGRKTADLSEMKTARAMIARALEIKPNAHFGREKYQLLAMDWILAVKMKKTDFSLSDFLSTRDEWLSDISIEATQKRRKATEGLSGLIVLGAAWRSVDVFDALAHSLKGKESITLSQLALLRTQELLKDGRKPLASDPSIEWELMGSNFDNFEGAINDDNQKTLAQLFPKLRAEAEDWNTARQNYMLTRLEKGDHPDTNPKFWADWKPAAPPGLELNWANEKQQKAEARQRFNSKVTMGFNLLGATILAGFCFGLWRFAKRRLCA